MLLSPGQSIFMKIELFINFIWLRLKNLVQINAPTKSLNYRVFMELFLKWLEWVHESFAIIILRRVLKKLDANLLVLF